MRTFKFESQQYGKRSSLYRTIHPNEEMDAIDKSIASCVAFNDWFDQTNTDTVDIEESPKALDLLMARRDAMEFLIKSAPEVALAYALSYKQRLLIPKDWTQFVEQRYSESVNLEVIVCCENSQHSHSPQFKVVRANGDILSLNPWGSQFDFLSKRELPVEGIALNGETVLFQDPYRELKIDEIAMMRFFYHNAIEGISSENLFGIPVLHSGSVKWVNDRATLTGLKSHYIQYAQTPGPDLVFSATEMLDQNTHRDDWNTIRDQNALISSWSTSPKKVLVLNTVFGAPDEPPSDDAERAFSELSQTPVGTNAEVQAVFQEVSDWIAQSSNGKTYLDVTVFPEIIELPYSVADYFGGVSNVAHDALDRAESLGYRRIDYDITVFIHANPWSREGDALLGGWYQNLYRPIDPEVVLDPGVVAHEFGHNYGLQHSSSWDSNDGRSLPGPHEDEGDGSHVEYGDPFSIMGDSDSYPHGDISPFGKYRLGWIDKSQIEDIVAPGIYRIYSIDSNTEHGKKVALKLKRGNSELFWIGYRTQFDEAHPWNTNIGDSAYLLWQRSDDRCSFIDATPDSQSGRADKMDGGIPLQNEFVDPSRLLYITPLSKGKDEFSEWMDVQVRFMLNGNTPPTVESIVSSTVFSAREDEISFEVVATDPDGDPLDIEWSLDSNVISNQSEFSRYFIVGGNRELILRVTDSKGGLSEETFSLEIDDPLTDLREYSVVNNGSSLGAGYFLDYTSFNNTYVGALHYLSSTICTSEDGINWTREDAEIPFYIRSITASDEGVVVVGDSSTIGFSRDLRNWEFPNIDHGWLQDVAYAHGMFIAVGEEAVVMSQNGIDWHSSFPVTGRRFYSVFATKDGFLIGGVDYTEKRAIMLFSNNGEDWIDLNVPGPYQAIAAFAGNGDDLIATYRTSKAGYLKSNDGGRSWVSRSFGFNRNSTGKIAYDNGLWVLLDTRNVLRDGNTVDHVIAKFFVSTNGEDWFPSAEFRKQSSSGIFDFVNGRLLVGSDNDTFFASRSLVPTTTDFEPFQVIRVTFDEQSRDLLLTIRTTVGAKYQMMIGGLTDQKWDDLGNEIEAVSEETTFSVPDWNSQDEPTFLRLHEISN